MKYEIKHQESYSRGDLLLRTFFGWLYMLIPHLFCLYFLAIWGSILLFITWWIILFTGKYPQNFFNYQVKVARWNTRLVARLLNLADGYPAFGLNATDDKTEFDVPYREGYSRGQLLLITFFGWLMAIPHFICVYFMMIGVYFVVFIAWWAVLFTGKYPKGMHDFVVSVLRWLMRVTLYLQFLYPTYPPFSGKREEELNPQMDKVLDAK